MLTPPRPRYHHGNLRQALLDAAVALAEEIGPEQVTMREAARRAGVSSAAPFRHFPTKTALMTAVAEEAMVRMLAEVARHLAEAEGEDPLVRFSALARGYLDFVVKNPTHFRILSDRRLLDWSESLRAGSAGLQAEMAGLLREAHALGLLKSGDIRGHLLDSRAVSYGVVRTYVDGQMPTWGVSEEEAPAQMAAVMARFIRNMAVDPDRHALRL
jgi:AcrR family transcriptional regulator